jgi:hypothetical protein
MSKYTTEVRFICESKSGLENSKGCDDVDEILNNSWNKIFTTKTEIFDENYRAVICKKILKHYYLREICSETVGIWKLWLNTRLEEILPYYNQLYKSALLEFNPLYDVNITRTHNRTIDENKTENGTSTETSTDKNTGSGTRDNTISGTNKNSDTSSVTDNGSSNSKDLYSDTPQGALTGVETETYLTNARKITNTDSSTSESTNSGNGEYKDTGNVKYTDTSERANTKNGSNSNTGTVNNTEEYLESVSGKQGGGSYSGMLKEYRETFLNIDRMVIGEFDDLFFGLW